MSELQDLNTPTLLVAMPQVRDPFFFQSVVLLVDHAEDGSYGFVVNRPTELRVQTILDDLEIEWRGDPEAAAYVGGPVAPQAGTVLLPTQITSSAAIPDGPSQALEELAPGVMATREISGLRKVASDPPAELRLILGYAGWGAGQLYDEIGRSDWVMAPIDSHLIFSRDSSEVWAMALASAGIDPSSLPDWFDPSQEAN